MIITFYENLKIKAFEWTHLFQIDTHAGHFACYKALPGMKLKFSKEASKIKSQIILIKVILLDILSKQILIKLL